FVCCVSAVGPVYAQRQSYLIPPKDTDPQIDTALESHYVAIHKSAPRKNQLFLFFPGTGARPEQYLRLSETAADLGFHVINLRYQNPTPINDLCGGTNTDLDCYEKVRMEIIDGADRTSLVTITRANSVENRVIKLLQYLQGRYPTDGWEQFLNSDGTIKWSLVVTSGHSQGGGHAGIIAKKHRIVRAVMFSAMDFNGAARQPANWIKAQSATPASGFYGFSHQRDGVNITILSTIIWPAYGMNAFGTVVNVDNAALPYNTTHSLTSNLDTPFTPGPPQVDYHNCVAVDDWLAKRADGTPVYKPVWEYLLATPREAANVSAASYIATPLATEAIVSAFGSGLATATMAASTTPLPTTLAGTSVKVRDSAGAERPAPLFFISPTQLNYLMPAGTVNGAATVTITSGAGAVSAGVVQI
ncbi:MAG: hypothetical protein L0219_06025, partial [Phycisphaerales bacterium]|nr:hypothetical protein [Phycisphaerales bacterium]